MKPKQPLRVGLVDADEDLHHAVRNCLTSPKLGWHWEAHSHPAHALAALVGSPPAVVLLDLPALGRAGHDCARRLMVALPGLSVVIFSARAGTGAVFTALTAGARGYLVKPIPPADLLPYLHRALAGGPALCPRAERWLLADLHGLGRVHADSGLSWREREVMQCLCQHRYDKACSVALGISAATVAAHLRKIFKKLKVHDRQAAIRRFLQPLAAESTAKAGQSRRTMFLPCLRDCPSAKPCENDCGQRA